MGNVVGNCRINCAEVIDHLNRTANTEEQPKNPKNTNKKKKKKKKKKKRREKGDCNKGSSNKLFVDFFPSPLLHLLGARRAVAVPFCSSADFYGP